MICVEILRIGAPLLREYGAKHSIEGSNPSLSATLTGLKS